MPNISIKAKGNGFTKTAAEVVNFINAKQMEQASTSGIEEFKSINPNSVNNVVSHSASILNKIKKMGKDAAESGKFPSGSADMKEKLDYNVDKDIEKRVKDNIRDESKTERPFGWDKLKSFSSLKENLAGYLKSVDALLVEMKDKKYANKLNYLQARIKNDLEKISSMENGDWKFENYKSTDSNTRKEQQKFFGKDQTGEEINKFNDELKKATIESIKNPAIRKMAYDKLDEVQKTNISQTITELEKNEGDYKKDIDVLNSYLAKEKEASVKTADEKESKEEKEVEEKDGEEAGEKDKEEKKENKKEDKKDEKKPAKKEDKKDEKGKGKKIDLKEKMKQLREMRNKKKEMPIPGKEEMGGDKPKIDLPKPGADKIMPKDDLMAEFTPMPTKASSYWEVKDGENKVILKFTGADAWGKDVFKQYKGFSNVLYGKTLLANIREKGLKVVAELVNGKYRLTKHAELIENKIKKATPIEKIVKKAELKKEALNPAEYIRGYFGKGDSETKGYGNQIAQLFKSQNKKAKAENEVLKKELAELKAQVNSIGSEKSELETEKVLRVKAERSLKLSSIMADKGYITKDDIEKVATQLTVMEDTSFAMMEDMFDKKVATKKEEKETIKKAFKVNGGLKNIPVMIENTDLKLSRQEQLTNALMNPKLAKLQTALAQYEESKNKK